ncbi:hypothetical protein CQ042_02670 [Microbacterium sp. MYb62]|nr:hypothetical protein CQ042_02670 [Microbacterium sp. MYb62]
MGNPLAFAGFAPADELALFGRSHPIEGFRCALFGCHREPGEVEGDHQVDGPLRVRRAPTIGVSPSEGAVPTRYAPSGTAISD